MVRLDSGFKITGANRAALTALGASNERQLEDVLGASLKAVEQAAPARSEHCTIQGRRYDLTILPDGDGWIIRFTCTAGIELLDLERRHSALLSAMAEGVMFHDAEGRIIYCNGRAEEIFGLSASEMTGFAPVNPGWPTVREDGSPFPCEEYPLAVTLRTGKALSHVVMGVRKPDGALIWLSISTRRVEDLSELGPGVVTTVRDITVRIAENQEHHRLQQRYQDLINLSPIGIKRIRRDGTLLSANPAIVRMLGFDTLQELRDAVSSGRYHVWNDPADRSRLAELAATRDVVEDFEAEFRRKDGTLIWVSLTCRRSVDSEDGAPSYDSYTRDITQRKIAEQRLLESEERYRSLFAEANAVLQSQSELVSRMDRDGRFLFANAACCRFLGKSLEELRACRWQPVVYQDDLASVLEAYQRLSRESPEHSIQCRSYNAAGQIRWMDYRIIGTFDRSGELIEVLSVGRDVTERKEMESRLAEVTAKLNQTIELSPCILSRFDREFRLIEVSPACRSMLGYEPDEMMEVSAARLIHPDDLAAVEAAFRQLEEDGPVVHVRHRALARNGSWIWLSSDARLLGNVIHAVSIDITEQVQAQEALNAERQFLKTLFDTMSQGVVYQNANGQVERANPAAERILGLTLGQMQGRTSKDPRWCSINEDGGEFRGEDHPAMVALRTGQPVTDVVMGVYNPAEGSVRWISINAVLRFEVGQAKPAGVYTVFSDITRTRQAQTALGEQDRVLRLALDASSSALWHWDSSDDSGFASPLFAEMLGLQVDELELRGSKVSSFIHADDAGAVLGEIQKCVDGKQNSFNLIHRMIHKSGRVLWVSGNGVVVDRRTHPRSVRLAGTVRDVTELVEARHLAECYAERRRDFLANMSHEIRTPMNGILGLAALLADTELTMEQRHLLTSIQTSGDSLLHLVNDVLDLSKVEAGKLSLESLEFEPATLAEQAMGVIRPVAAAKGLSLHVRVSDSVPLFVMGDPNRMQQVLVNLLSNAVKYTNRGTIELSVDGTIAKESVTLSIEVRDTGIGMTAEQMSRVFSAFEQAERRTARLFGGTGLGLAISRMLIEMMGGSIEVTSQLGQGSAFRFTVVLKTAPEPQPVERAASPSSTILLRASTQTEQRLRTRQLESAGINVQCSSESAPHMVVLAPDSLGTAKAWIEELSEAASRCAGPLLVITPPDLDSAASLKTLPADNVRWLHRPVSCRRLLDAVTRERCGAPPNPDSRSCIPDKWRGKRVLVAEDNVVNQLVAGTMLERLGCLVTFANDGQDAFDQTQSGASFDIVLMDCQMPKVDGLEATRRIRSSAGEAATIPVIALSAGVLAEERQACLECGMDAFLGKPFSMAELCRVLDTFVR